MGFTIKDKPMIKCSWVSKSFEAASFCKIFPDNT